MSKLALLEVGESDAQDGYQALRETLFKTSPAWRASCAHDEALSAAKAWADQAARPDYGLAVVHGSPEWALAAVCRGVPTIVLAAPCPTDPLDAAARWGALSGCAAVHLDLRAHILTRGFVRESQCVIPWSPAEVQPTSKAPILLFECNDAPPRRAELLEAMAAATCIVAPRTPWFQSLIADRISGRLLGANDDTRATMNALSPADSARMGRAAALAAARMAEDWAKFSQTAEAWLAETATHLIEPPCTPASAEEYLGKWTAGDPSAIRRLSLSMASMRVEQQDADEPTVGAWQSLARVRRFMRDAPGWAAVRDLVPVRMRRTVAQYLSRLLDRIE